MFFLTRILLIFTLLSGVAGITAAGEKSLQLPPDSIAQWYKPQNKRQVWLHTMFSLRREMQAVGEYAAIKNKPGVDKWSERLVAHYRKIGEMVPEWADELEVEWVEKLESAAATADFDGVNRALYKLGQNCQGCHREFQAITTLLYRSPDFSGLKVGERTYVEHMQLLTRLINRIKIAHEDGLDEVALESVSALRQELAKLDEGCAGCHRDPRATEYYMGEKTALALDALEHDFTDGDRKRVGRDLGTLAVINCAQCHGVHRTLHDVRKILK